MAQKLIFPKGFLWGAAGSAYQTEGNNTNSDWWVWEHSVKRENFLRAKGLNPADFQSGIACDFYNRFDEDFGLAQHLNHNATRFGIEWARIQPKEGVFDERVLDHYEKILQSAKFHGLTTFVTLHHFTSPAWFIKRGGFTKKENIQFFINYVEKVTERFNEYVDFWLTINEPELYSTSSYSTQVPQNFGFFDKIRVAKNLIRSHNLAANLIRHRFRKPVSMAFHLSDLQPWGVLGGFASSVAHFFANEYILGHTIQQCDFIGVNYYFHHHVGVFGPRRHSHSGHELSDVGFGIHPEGLERLLLSLRKYNKPIYITENGVADAHDAKREKFIVDHLYYMHRAIQQGADVRGYLHWSLTDNFEWGYGFDPRFGLVAIDRDDLLRRRVRHSALSYAEVCKNNCLEIGGTGTYVRAEALVKQKQPG